MDDASDKDQGQRASPSFLLLPQDVSEQGPLHWRQRFLFHQAYQQLLSGTAENAVEQLAQHLPRHILIRPRRPKGEGPLLIGLNKKRLVRQDSHQGCHGRVRPIQAVRGQDVARPGPPSTPLDSKKRA